MFFSILLLCLGSRVVFAREYAAFGPVELRTQNPIYLQHLGLTPRRAQVLPEGVIEMRTDSAYSNIFERGEGANELVDLDMEYWRLALRALYGLTDDLEVGVEIPFVHFGGGFLDAFIQGFHDAFGLPNAGRNTVPNGRFSYRLASGGADIVNYSPADFGLGDISLHVKHQLTGEDEDWPAIAWFSEIKLPSGRRARGFGSGGPDFGLGAAIDVSYKRIHGYFNLGYYVLGGNARMDGFMRSQMMAYMIAGEATILPNWSAIVELNGSTPLLKGTGIDPWDGLPLDLVVGFRGEEEDIFGGSDLIWQFGFSEDVTSRGPSVDFTVFASIGMRFDLFGRAQPVGDWIAKTRGM